MKVIVESAALWTWVIKPSSRGYDADEPPRFFVLMNFIAFLANSNLSFTFLDMVRLP